MMAELRRKAAVDRRDKIEALTREIAILAAKVAEGLDADGDLCEVYEPIGGAE